MDKNLEFYFTKLQQNKTQRTFEQVYKLSSVRLFGVILRILKRKELSEDCLQEVYIKIWNRIDTYNATRANIMTWMSTIARNHAIDYVRKHELPIQDDFELSAIKDNQVHFLDNLEANDANKQLTDCLGQLKDNSRNVCLWLTLMASLMTILPKRLARQSVPLNLGLPDLYPS